MFLLPYGTNTSTSSSTTITSTSTSTSTITSMSTSTSTNYGTRAYHDVQHLDEQLTVVLEVTGTGRYTSQKFFLLVTTYWATNRTVRTFTGTPLLSTLSPFRHHHGTSTY